MSLQQAVSMYTSSKVLTNHEMTAIDNSVLNMQCVQAIHGMATNGGNTSTIMDAPLRLQASTYGAWQPL